ncbi:MAG: hypothetical protein NVSMB64_07960 [Candidatus Velthaea sp.]
MMTGFIRRAKRTVYENPWLRFEAHDIVHPNGRPGEHGVVVTPPASAVVVVDGTDVVFARQARFAVGDTVLEIIKGGANPGESAIDCAKREMREEVGYAAGRWDALGIAYEIPSIVEQPVSLFLARDLRAVATAQEHVESIDTVRMPFMRALEAVASGEMDDAVTALALFRAARLMRAG